MIWVVSTNTNTCHIYHFQRKPAKIQLLKEITYPQNKLKTGDFLTSDKPGHYQSGPSSRGTYTQATDPKEVEIDKFSREVANALEAGRNSHAYEQLIIIAPAHMNGLLFQHLNEQVKKMVINNFKKDFPKISDKELLDFLTHNAKFHDK